MPTTKNSWILLSKITIGIIMILLIVFVVYQFRSSWSGPHIKVTYPIPGQTVYNPILVISGDTSHVAQLTVQGSPVPIVLKSEQFYTEISLPVGSSVITLDGYSRSGKHTQLQLPIYYKPFISNQPIPKDIQILEKLQLEATPFRATSDLLEAAQTLQN